jgi:hypothetical protein
MAKKEQQAASVASAPKQVTAPVAAPVASPEQAAATPPELTIQDLGNLRAIIDVASQRGAFRATEMAAVGATFNKLNDFLNVVAPPAEAAPAA